MGERELTDLSRLVLAYKVLKGFKEDDKLWDKVHYARCTRSARILLDLFGELSSAWNCLTTIADKFDSIKLTWTLETIVKHAHEWKLKNEGIANGPERSV